MEIMVLPSGYVMKKSLQLSSLFLLLVLSTMRLQDIGVSGTTWQRPNCHLLGHERRIHIANCVEFTVTTNACRGYCLSYAHPTPFDTENTNLITSKGECCSIGLTHDITYSVKCNGKDGFTSRNLTFKSARTCHCSACQTSGSSFNGD